MYSMNRPSANASQGNTPRQMMSMLVPQTMGTAKGNSQGSQSPYDTPFRQMPNPANQGMGSYGRGENPYQSQYRSVPSRSGGGINQDYFGGGRSLPQGTSDLLHRFDKNANQNVMKPLDINYWRDGFPDSSQSPFMNVSQNSNSSSASNVSAPRQLPSIASRGMGAHMLGAAAQLPSPPQNQQVMSQPAPQSSRANTPNVLQSNYQSMQSRTQSPYIDEDLAAFQNEARRLNSQPQESVGKIISDRITENMANARKEGVLKAEEIVNQNLAQRQGFYPTPDQRRGGFNARGMGKMPGDQAIMDSQKRPLGDGGPAAAAAKQRQEGMRLDAVTAMEGEPSDGLTRYMPNKDLLAFANAYRANEDSEKAGMLKNAGFDIGSAGARSPMKAMTPNEIQFYRHKMNMATNPKYAERVEAKRAEQQAILNNRRNMAAARRAGALEAAGASQQMRNLMAGRGAIAGQDGFNALMSLAAMQNPNQAFENYGQAYTAQTAPGMQSERLGSQERMYSQGLASQENMLGMNLGSQERMYGQGLKSQSDLLGMNLGSQERMQGANIGSQEKMFGQGIESRERMFDKQTEADRLREYRAGVGDILNRTDLSDFDKQQMLNSYNATFRAGRGGAGQSGGLLGSLMSGLGIPGFGSGQSDGLIDTVPSNPFGNIPQFPQYAGESKDQAYDRGMQWLEMYGKNLTPEQQQQWMARNGLVLTDAERQQAIRNSGTVLNPYDDPAGMMLGSAFGGGPLGQGVANWLLEGIGMDLPSRLERENKLKRLLP